MLTIAAAHNVSCNTSIQKNKTRLAKTILQHRCLNCPRVITVFVPTNLAQTSTHRVQKHRQHKLLPLNDTVSNIQFDAKFPPPSSSREVLDSVFRGFLKAIQLENFIEGLL